MTGSTPGLIITSIVVVIALAAWIVLVFYADAHPAWRREAPSGHRTVDLATPGRPEAKPDSESGETEVSPPAGRESGASAARAAGMTSGRTTAS